jgi:beta-glucosidase-like glycosyl hydrolase
MIMHTRTKHRIHIVVTSACGFALLTGGCVRQSTYDAALQEGITTRAELERAKDEHKVLLRQVREMELLNADVVREAEAATSALQQAKDDAEHERQQAEQRIARMQQKAAQASKQQRSLQYEITVAKENAAALQDIIDGYQRKVRDGAGLAPASPAPEPAVHKPFDPSTIPVPQDLPAAPAVTPPKPVPPPPAPTPASTPAKTSQPAPDEGWVSSIKNWLVSLWQSIFS